MRLDPIWYAHHYPLPAFEGAQGDYAAFAQHYVAIDKTRGYCSYPPENRYSRQIVPIRKV
jgi:hypothetical protein